jgi:hypothetical protein
MLSDVMLKILSDEINESVCESIEERLRGCNCIDEIEESNKLIMRDVDGLFNSISDKRELNQRLKKAESATIDGYEECDDSFASVQYWPRCNSFMVHYEQDDKYDEYSFTLNDQLSLVCSCDDSHDFIPCFHIISVLVDRNVVIETDL